MIIQSKPRKFIIIATALRIPILSIAIANVAIFFSNTITMALDMLDSRYDLIRSGHSNHKLIDKKGETIDVFRRDSSQPGYTTCTCA